MAKTWKDCPREDLFFMDLMIEKGFKPRFSYTDKRNERTTPENVPHDAVAYEKNQLVAWRLYASGEFNWNTAILIDGRYQNHKEYILLLDIVNDVEDGKLKTESND